MQHPSEPQASQNARSETAENPWLSLGINIVVPALILMKLSSEDRLGPVFGLIVASPSP